MSEFSSGFLILKKNGKKEETLLKSIKTEIILKDLNNKWAVFFIESETFMELEKVDKILDISKKIPVIYFFNAEDHGWGYNIFHEGKEIAKSEIVYCMANQIAMSLAQERYPGTNIVTTFITGDSIKDEWENIFNEAHSSEIFKEAVYNQFRNKNVKEFQLFGISTEKIEQLDELLCAEKFLSDPDYEFEMVDEFKRILGIEEFSWMSYSYLADT